MARTYRDHRRDRARIAALTGGGGAEMTARTLEAATGVTRLHTRAQDLAVPVPIRVPEPGSPRTSTVEGTGYAGVVGRVAVFGPRCEASRWATRVRPIDSDGRVSIDGLSGSHGWDPGVGVEARIVDHQVAGTEIR